MIHARRSLSQVRRTDGYLSGALRYDRGLAYWTLTVWRDERALLAYVTSGAHRNAMPKLLDWGDEASTARWEQEDTWLPEWPMAVERMRRNGKALPLRHAGPDHASIGFADVDPTHTARI